MRMDLIRQAILKNCGGFKEASDSQIATKWNSLNIQTQERYLQSIKPARERKNKNAPGDKP